MVEEILENSIKEETEKVTTKTIIKTWRVDLVVTKERVTPNSREDTESSKEVTADKEIKTLAMTKKNRVSQYFIKQRCVPT